MKKETIIIGIIILMLIGVASANVIPYFAQVTGSAEINGPIFYAGENSDGDLHLWINDFDKFQEENIGSSISILEEEQKTFFTDELEEMDFYNPEIKLQVKAKLINGTVPKKLELEFGYFDEDPDGNIYTIGNCEKEIEIESSEDYEIEPIICQGDSEIPEIKGFYYTIRGRGTGGVEIDVELNEGETRAEILGAI